MVCQVLAEALERQLWQYIPPWQILFLNISPSLSLSHTLNLYFTKTTLFSCIQFPDYTNSTDINGFGNKHFWLLVNSPTGGDTANKQTRAMIFKPICTRIKLSWKMWTSFLKTKSQSTSLRTKNYFMKICFSSHIYVLSVSHEYWLPRTCRTHKYTQTHTLPGLLIL
jgi:hypothetical protein